MLNLKADQALGNEKWRIMGRYEIQHRSYKTFEELEADAIDLVTGNHTQTPNGISLLRRDSEQGNILGVDSGWASIMQNAIINDTRNFEPGRTKGAFFEITNEYSSKLFGSQFDFDKLLIQGRYFQKLPFGRRTVLVGRAGIGNVFEKNAPFFEYKNQWSP